LDGSGDGASVGKDDKMKSHALVWVLMGSGIALAACPVWAQRPGPGMLRYDPATEMTLCGTVAEAGEVDCSGGPPGMKGTHFTLKSGEQSFDVHLGPTNYLADRKFASGKGEQVVVTGSKVRQGGAEMILAREVKSGEQTITLRDSLGIPAWSRSIKERIEKEQ
jgi:hypothetical protein